MRRFVGNGRPGGSNTGGLHHGLQNHGPIETQESLLTCTTARVMSIDAKFNDNKVQLPWQCVLFISAHLWKSYVHALVIIQWHILFTLYSWWEEKKSLQDANQIMAHNIQIRIWAIILGLLRNEHQHRLTSTTCTCRCAHPQYLYVIFTNWALQVTMMSYNFGHTVTKIKMSLWNKQP